jgi:hypothetical protein
VERVAVEGASLLIVQAADEGALKTALAASEGSTAPFWIVHGKGKAAAFGDNAPVRALMRGRGFIDTKVSAVSDALSATRYVRR